MENKSSSFQGFTPDTVPFLRDIAAHNSKPWFEANKDRYRTALLGPFQELVCALSDLMLAIDPFFVTIPAIGRTISRIYRDTRFSKDKSLFRCNMWLTFKRPTKDWLEAPSYFFEITTAGYRYGMGFYSASKDTMDAFRKAIDEAPDRFLKVIDFYQPGNPFALEGDSYKRILVPGQPPEIQNWYQKKSFYLTHNHPIDDLLFKSELVKTVEQEFLILAPLYEYLWEIKAGEE